ncbi:hypothetical protein P4S72_27150 [Vibrio sp. PP-XX7]
MRELNIDFDTSVLDEAFRHAPEQLNQSLKAGVQSAGLFVARAAREEAPKAESTLIHSIRANVTGTLERMITSHLNYNGMVVTGAPSQGMPPVRSILDWIRVKHIQPHNPNQSQRDLAFMMARSIAAKGSAGNDFYDRAADATQDQVTDILYASVRHGLNAAGLGSL